MTLDAMGSTPAAGPELSAARLAQVAAAVRESLGRQVLGQKAAIDALLAAYLAGGHALVEGVPGIAKTLLARCFAACLGVEMTRIQFTPDLMPSDLLGTNVFDQKAGSFRLVRGPIFTRVLMADEVNRTPPKTQSALLEAMQECQTTIDGVTYPLPAGFFVVATQNPLEFEGVYPLPEAQLDRFLVKIEMGLPEPAAELAIFQRAVAGDLAGWDADVPLPAAVASPEEAPWPCAGRAAASTSPQTSSATSPASPRGCGARRTSSWVPRLAGRSPCSRRRGPGRSSRSGTSSRPTT
jgi:MoxR-like ATPase